MDFSLTKSQLLLQKLAKDFTEKEVAPLAADLDATGNFPIETFQKMVKVGFTGMCTPKEYGGSGGNDLDKTLVLIEIAKKCASTAATLSIHMIFANVLLKFGTEEQKQKYLPMVTQGGKVAAFALTEANAGSDAGNVRTTALLDEQTQEYVLNGSKCFITGGAQADVLMIFALTQQGKGLKGMSCVIVEKGMPGFTTGKIEEKMGLHASQTAELIFDNCRVPKKNLVGKEGKGFNIAMTALDGARIGVGAQAVGLAEGAIEESVKYMKERVQFGNPISNLQGLQWYLADMATKTEAAKWLVFYAASLAASGQTHTKEVAMAKLNAAENARFVTNLALQIHGGYGYMKDYPLERMYRDAKITEIYEGTSEIHKVVIAREILKR